MILLRVSAPCCLRFCLSVGFFGLFSLSSGLGYAQTRYAQSEFPAPIEIETLPAVPDNGSEPLLDASPASPPILRPDTVPETIEVSAFEVIGSTVFSEIELAAVTDPYLLNGSLTPTELFDVRSAITQLYIDNGYVNSGAYIPPQTLSDGVVQIQVLEGRLAAINVDVEGRLSPGYVRRRLALAGATPLNSEQLLEGLRLLQLDPLIESITAELATGTEPGTSLLDVEVVVADPFDMTLRTDNNRSPSVGSWRRGAAIAHRNILGQGDGIELEYLNTSGSDDVNLDYTFPINARNGTLRVNAGRSDSSVIEDPFTTLDIQSESQNYGFSWRQPIVQTPTDELALGLSLTHQRSKTDFLEDVIGESVGFPSPGADIEGRTRLSALRFSQEWTQTSDRDVLALFSEFSLGLDILDATTNDNAPDSQFFSWRGQAQWVKLLGPETLLLLRGGLQLSDDDLLPLEEFGLGGQETVRGYRQNVLLTDNGFSLTGEVRFPLYRNTNIDGLLQLTPFIDIGGGWNHTGANPDPNVLVSTGIGLLWRQGDRLSARLDWGIPLVDIDKRTSSLQENGIYFTIDYRLF